jgi:hypothetical protein
VRADTDAGGGRTLTLFLTKDNGMEWWAAVAEGEPAIDVTRVSAHPAVAAGRTASGTCTPPHPPHPQIEPESSKLGDLDGETRVTVEKMMFDQRQRARGLPTADELKKQVRAPMAWKVGGGGVRTHGGWPRVAQEMMAKFMAAHPEMDFSKAKFM